MKKNLSFILIILLITSACGFKVVNQSSMIKFYVSELNTTGDGRINFNIKNRFLSLPKNNDKIPIILNLKTKKSKTIKEKNINNEITKYVLKVNIVVEFADSNLKNSLVSFSVEEKGDYTVNTQHSRTIANEKKLIKVLSSKLYKRVLKELSIRLNDK